MTEIPRTALILGLSGLIPFLFGAGTLVSDGLATLGMNWFGPRFIGPYVQIFYGTIILSFMSGVLWGFSARAEGPAAQIGYGLSVIPALWAFFFVGGGPVAAQINLIAGFVGLLGIDYHFWRQGLTPRWWMHLRILLTSVVVLCLAVGVVL